MTLTVLTLLISAAIEPELDAASGLKKAPDWELVRAHCGACHSLRLVTSQRGDRHFWLKTIRWMQEKQNLWVLPAPQEDKILTYLSTQYAADSWGRRPPLPAMLMPAKPRSVSNPAD